jgi:hypothetical protein
MASRCCECEVSRPLMLAQWREPMLICEGDAGASLQRGDNVNPFGSVAQA